MSKHWLNKGLVQHNHHLQSFYIKKCAQCEQNKSQSKKNSKRNEEHLHSSRQTYTTYDPNRHIQWENSVAFFDMALQYTVQWTTRNNKKKDDIHPKTVEEFLLTLTMILAICKSLSSSVTSCIPFTVINNWTMPKDLIRKFSTSTSIFQFFNSQITDKSHLCQVYASQSFLKALECKYIQQGNLPDYPCFLPRMNQVVQRVAMHCLFNFALPAEWMLWLSTCANS